MKIFLKVIILTLGMIPTPSMSSTWQSECQLRANFKSCFHCNYDNRPLSFRERLWTETYKSCLNDIRGKEAFRLKKAKEAEQRNKAAREREIQYKKDAKEIDSQLDELF